MPTKSSAHGKVSWAIKRGLIIPQPCEICGKNKVVAHHTDYSKPLEVHWLCTKHHKIAHKNFHPESDKENSECIKIHDDTYLMLQEMAAKQGRTIVKTLDMIVLAEFMQTKNSSGNSLPETLAQEFMRKESAK